MTRIARGKERLALISPSASPRIESPLETLHRSEGQLNPD